MKKNNSRQRNHEEQTREGDQTKRAVAESQQEQEAYNLPTSSCKSSFSLNRSLTSSDTDGDTLSIPANNSFFSAMVTFCLSSASSLSSDSILTFSLAYGVRNEGYLPEAADSRCQHMKDTQQTSPSRGNHVIDRPRNKTL